MVDTVARIFFFLSLRLQGISGKNTRFLTYPHKRKSHDMMSWDLGGHSSRGRSVSWIESPIQHRGRCSLRNLRTSWWKWAAEPRLAAKWSRWFLPIAVGRVAPSACPDTWSLSLFSPEKKGSEDPCAWYGTKDLYFGRIPLMFNDDMWGFSAPRSGTMAIHFPVKWNVLSSLNVSDLYSHYHFLCDS